MHEINLHVALSTSGGIAHRGGIMGYLLSIKREESYTTVLAWISLFTSTTCNSVPYEGQGLTACEYNLKIKL